MSLDLKGNIISSTDITSVGVFKTKVNNDGLVSYLDAGDLNSYPGSGTVWYDLNQNINYNMTDITYTGSTFVFNGTSSYAISASVIEFERTDKFSLCSWVNSTTVNNQQIINNENSSYAGYSILIHSTNTVSFNLRNSATVLINIKSVATLSPNTWYHICGTYNGNGKADGMSIYINGVKQSITVSTDNLSTSSTISGVNTRIGNRLPATYGWFNGNISIAQIYSRELNPYEIAEKFQAQRGRFGI